MLTRFTKTAAIVLLTLLPFKDVNAGTGGLNGGDIIFSYLKDIRFSLAKTLSRLNADFDGNRDQLCQRLQGEEEKTFCISFIKETMASYLALSDNDIPKFVVSEERLFVEGPSGTPIQVSARTPLGPAGNVEYHYDSVKNLNPEQMLFLIAHEFGHKVSFAGTFVPDNEPIGPFANGRELLDAVAWSLVDVAKNHRFIGTSFTLLDKLACFARKNLQPVAYNKLITPRLFFAQGNYDHYELSIGNGPNETEFKIPDVGGSLLEFRLKIRDTSGCKNAGTGKAVLSLVRTKKGFEEELLVERVIHTNPLCFEPAQPMSLMFEIYDFECIYEGSFSTTERSRAQIQASKQN